MSTKRPVNLNLFTIKQPVTAIASILHRISGLLVFLFIPFLLWALQHSLKSADGFASVANAINCPIAKFLIWGFLSALIYHLIAGIRHLLMDLGIGESLKTGRLGAWVVIVLAVIAIVLLGWWLW